MLYILLRMDGKLSMFRNSRLYSYVHDLEHLFHNFFYTCFTIFLRFTQYNADAHNTHAHSPLHVCKPYPYEHLRRTEHRQIWRFSKSPLAPRRRQERPYHLTHNAGKSRNKSRKRCEHQDLNPGG
jgi:hypothetical protein